MNITEIVSFLAPSKWTSEESQHSPNSFTITRATDGLQLLLRQGGYGNEGKIRISFLRPRDSKGQSVMVYENHVELNNPKIGVSENRPSKEIAGAITKRLIPTAVKLLGLVNEKIAQSNNFYNTKEAAIRRICEVLQVKPTLDRSGAELSTEIDPYIASGVPSFQKKGYGKISVSGAESISIELKSMDLKTAEKIVAAISEALKSVN